MKRARRQLVVTICLLALLANGPALRAQDVNPVVREKITAEVDFLLEMNRFPEGSVKFLSSRYFGKVVKGAPYSATAITEHIQTLSDGNQIIRKNEAKLYRDSEGRTRREQKVETTGKSATAGEVTQGIYINDPVAGVSYNLDPRTRSVRKGSIVKPIDIRQKMEEMNEKIKRETEERIKRDQERAKRKEEHLKRSTEEAKERSQRMEEQARERTRRMEEQAKERTQQMKERETRLKEESRVREGQLKERTRERTEQDNEREREHAERLKEIRKEREADEKERLKEREKRQKELTKEREERAREITKVREKHLQEMKQEREARAKILTKEREKREKEFVERSKLIEKQHKEIEKVMREKRPAKEITDPDGRKKIETLGKRTIEGVEAEGTRSTRTIPTGEIGNTLPIEIVDESWYSQELQLQVMTRHSDPRSGVTTYRLTNISRSEPARSLFEVPAEYTLNDSSMPKKPAPKLEPPQGSGLPKPARKPEPAKPAGSPESAKPARKPEPSKPPVQFI